MKKNVAAASRAQATAMSKLLIGVLVGFALGACEKVRRNFRAGGRDEGGAVAPAAYYLPENSEGDERNHNRHDPGNEIEPFRRRRGEDRGAVFLDESLNGEIVRLVARDALVELLDHVVRIGAAHMVAGDKNLVAAADAHQFLAEGASAGSFLSEGVRRKEKQDD